jgi:ribosome-binding protein aMBF1 (putative translation factor)
MASKSASSFHEKRHARRKRESAEYSHGYDQAAIEIAQVDELIRQLDEARERLGMSKAELAREIGKNPQVVRRLFSAEGRNPELKTVAAIASALGGRVTIDFPAASQ